MLSNEPSIDPDGAAEFESIILRFFEGEDGSTPVTATRAPVALDADDVVGANGVSIRGKRAECAEKGVRVEKGETACAAVDAEMPAEICGGLRVG